MDQFIDLIEKLADTPAGQLMLILAIVLVGGGVYVVVMMIRAFRQSQKVAETNTASFMELNADMIRIIDRQGEQMEKHNDILDRVGDAMIQLTRQNERIESCLSSFPATVAAVADTVQAEHQDTRVLIARLGEAQGVMQTAQGELYELVTSLIALVQSSQANDTDIKEMLSNYGQQLLSLSELFQVMKLSIDALMKTEPETIS